MTDSVITTTITVSSVTAELDLDVVVQHADGPHGRLIAIGHQCEPYPPHVPRPVLHFQLPDGRVVLTCPDTYGDYRLVWRDTKGAARIDDDLTEVLHQMWWQVNDGLQNTLLPEFADAATRALSDTLSPRADQVDTQSVTDESGPARGHIHAPFRQHPREDKLMNAPAVDDQTPTAVIERHPAHGFVITGATGTDLAAALYQFGYRAVDDRVLALPASMDEHLARQRQAWAAQLLAGAGHNVVIQASSRDVAVSTCDITEGNDDVHR